MWQYQYAFLSVRFSMPTIFLAVGGQCIMSGMSRLKTRNNSLNRHKRLKLGHSRSHRIFLLKLHQSSPTALLRGPTSKSIITLLALPAAPTLRPSTLLDPGDILFTPLAPEGPPMTLRLSLLGGAAACDVASPRRLGLDAVLDVRRAGAVELDGALLMPGLVVVDVLAIGRLPGAAVEAIDILDPGLLPAALLDVMLLTVVDPMALIGFRIVDGGLGCGTNGAVPAAPPDTVLAVVSRLVLAILFTAFPCSVSNPSSSGSFLFLPGMPVSIIPIAFS